MEYRIDKSNSDKTFALTIDGRRYDKPANYEAASDGSIIVLKNSGIISYSIDIAADTLYIGNVLQTDVADAVLQLNDIVNFNTGGGTSQTTLPPYESGKHYRESQAIVEDGVIYTAKADFTSGDDFDEEDWNKIGVGVDDLDLKLDKLNTTGTFAYTHSDDTQGEIPLVAGDTTPSTIPVRKEDTGALEVGEPVDDEDATTKGYVDTAIGSEATARSSADTTLQANINTEATTRAEADDILHDAIDDETEAREDADDAINLRIGAILGKKSNLTAYDFGTDDKDDLQALLTAYAETQHPEWDDDIPNSVAVNNLFNNHEWIYNKDDDEWIDNGQATVQTATNTQQGIVQGTADDGTPDTEGKVSVIAGIMSVNGFNNKANKIKFPAVPFDGSNLNVAPPRILRFDVAKTPEVTGLGGQGFVAWQVAGHPFHLFGAWVDGIDGDGKTRIGLFQFQNNELTSVRDIFDGDVWLASDWLLTYGINGTRQDVGTLSGFDFATDMSIPALPDFDLSGVADYMQKKISASFGNRTIVVCEPDGTVLGDETELVTDIPDTYIPALENQVPTVGAVFHGLEEGGKVQSVDGIIPDAAKNVVTEVFLTQAEFDALVAADALTENVKYRVTDAPVYDDLLKLSPSIPDYSNPTVLLTAITDAVTVDYYDSFTNYPIGAEVVAPFTGRIKAYFRVSDRNPNVGTVSFGVFVDGFPVPVNTSYPGNSYITDLSTTFYADVEKGQRLQMYISTRKISAAAPTSTIHSNSSTLIIYPFINAYTVDPLDKPDVYSTTEVVTNKKWLNKPVYRRVFTGTITAEANSIHSEPLVTTPTIDKIIGWGGEWFMSSAGGGTLVPICMYIRATCYSRLVRIVDSVYNTLGLISLSDYARTDAPYELWVEYTKLSDL